MVCRPRRIRLLLAQSRQIRQMRKLRKSIVLLLLKIGNLREVAFQKRDPQVEFVEINRVDKNG